MLSSLCWVPRGKANTKLPTDVDITRDGADDEEQPDDTSLANILSKDLDSLSFYERGQKDPNLKDSGQHALFSDDEIDDLTMRSTDAMIVATNASPDLSTLEMHVLEDDPQESDDEDETYEPHVYVHHDLTLPVLPLCTAYTQVEGVNLVAVGMFMPGIGVWDTDQTSNLEPVVMLGGTKLKGNGKSQGLKEGSHRGAVMTVDWNVAQPEYLVSGGEDTIIKVWDIESAHCATNVKWHQGKVQSAQWSREKPGVVVSGGFDRKVFVGDMRGPEAVCWKVDADVEKCKWIGVETFVVSDESGSVGIADVRKPSEWVNNWKAHKGAATSVAVSDRVQGMVVTAGVDKKVKVWDVREDVELVYERMSKAGSVFAMELCPVEVGMNMSPFVTAWGGAGGSLRVVDLAVESKEVRERFLDGVWAEGKQVVQRRAARQEKAEDKEGREMESEASEDDEDGNEDEMQSE